MPGRTEYLREVGEVIGWDDGKDATLSYAECSGGLAGSRAFHGRPMTASNPKVARLAPPPEQAKEDEGDKTP